MVRFLNVGILQMPVSPSLEENQAYLCRRLEELMNGYHKPELVVGVEWIGMYAAGPIPGPCHRLFRRPSPPVWYLLDSRHHERNIPLSFRRGSSTMPLPSSALTDG